MIDSAPDAPDAQFEAVVFGAPEVGSADSGDAGPAAGDDKAASGGRSRPRRRRRGVLAGLLALVCLAGGGLVGAEHYVRSQVDPTVRAALPGLSTEAAISTEGPLLPQVLRNRLDTLSIRADTLTIESDGADGAADPSDTGAADSGLAAVTGLELTDVGVNLTDVGIRAPYRVGHVDASGVIGFEELERIVAAAVPDAPELTITPETYGSAAEPGRVTATTNTVLGLQASLTIEPEVTDAGGLELDIVRVRVAGMNIDVDPDGEGMFAMPSVLSHFGLSSSTIEVGIDALPAGMRLSRAYIARDGVRVSLVGNDITLADG
ncbi:DUF2993 domain-containing protein [Actinomyces sp.]|uniref:LmeA family phospholipid-binding protein n=1 Tax=Actinomyces sp. TaxID=29317 RepID=UPI0026DB860B|nr:DUF2993 domain-containing protein [Actinomyces sp.]MDO4900150.1 DUF2993 domain-containing protein [Actinomyces sp.]